MVPSAVPAYNIYQGARPHAMASAVARACNGACNGGLWAEPPAGFKGRALGQGVRGAKPPEAETLLAFGRSMEAANLPTFPKSRNTKYHGHLCCLDRQCGLLLLYTA